MEANKIKRVAQFLFDNATMIVDELAKTDNYRSLNVSFGMFKTDGSKDLAFDLTFYDSTQTHIHLKGERICLHKFKQICKQVNEDTGCESLPEPEKLRAKL